MRTAYGNHEIDSNPMFHPITKQIKGETIANFREIGDIGHSYYAFSYDLTINGKTAERFIVASTDDKGSFHFIKYNSREEYERAANDWKNL